MTPIMREMKEIAGAISEEIEQKLVVESLKNLNR